MPAASSLWDQPVELIGPLPHKDGAVHRYDVSRYANFFHSADGLPGAQAAQRSRGRNHRLGAYRVVFVNGQDGNPDKHKAQACAVAAVSGGPVTGVYNASNGLPVLGDTTQSLVDKATSRLELTAWAALGRRFGPHGDQSAVRVVYNRLRALNPATASLFLLLTRPEFADARIVAHSQGNLITANALSALMAVRGADAIHKMRVYAVASPTFFWGDAKRIVKTFNFINDGVGWLSGNVMFDGWAPRRGSGPLGSVAGGYAATAADKKAQTVGGYVPAKWNRLTHSFYIYLGALWDDLAGEFP